MTTSNILDRLENLHQQHAVKADLMQQEGALFSEARELIVMLQSRAEELEHENQNLKHVLNLAVDDPLPFLMHNIQDEAKLARLAVSLGERLGEKAGNREVNEV